MGWAEKDWECGFIGGMTKRIVLASRSYMERHVQEIFHFVLTQRFFRRRLGVMRLR